MIIEDFSLEVAGRIVPGVVYLPDSFCGRAPVLLAQHGGSSHKKGVDILDWAELFVERRGMALVAIDGPVHGGRRRPGCAQSVRDDFFALWRSVGSGVDGMVNDWQAVLDWLSNDARLDSTRIGWLGLSMGTAYGIPLLASENRIKAAVIGMWGLSFVNSNRLAVDAQQITCPTLFQQKANDQLFTQDGQLALFSNIGTTTKQHKIYPGLHVQVQGEQLCDLENFLVSRLTPFTPSDSRDELIG